MKMIKTYQNMIDIDFQKKDELYNEMGICYTSIGKFDEAIVAYTQAVHLNSKKSYSL